MNTKQVNQMTAAILRDGAIKMSAEDIAAALAEVEMDVYHRFLGVVQPNSSPGRIYAPAMVAALAGGTYRGFSSQSVNEGQIVIFVTTDGGYWDKVVAFDPNACKSGSFNNSFNDSFDNL